MLFLPLSHKKLRGVRSSLKSARKNENQHIYEGFYVETENWKEENCELLKLRYRFSIEVTELPKFEEILTQDPLKFCRYFCII